MTLYLAAGALGLLALFLMVPLSTWLARADWVCTAPRSAVALWQSIGLSAMIAAIGAGLCVVVARYHAGFIGGVAALVAGAFSGHPLRGLGLPDALGLTLAADLGVVLACLLGAVMVRTIVARAHHRQLLNLLAQSRPGHPGTDVLDHPAAVAYCLPGVRPRIVISSGTLDLLNDGEVAAVVEHERGHAHERHGLVMLPMVGLSDLFSWIPFARLAPSCVAELLEMAADDFSARRHAPAWLASSLVKLATSTLAPTCSFSVANHGVQRRIVRLRTNDRRSRRAAAAAGILAGLILAAPVSLMIGI
jgi:Zn-dependent protease with chaperone function